MEQVDAADGFINHQEQYNEIFQSKHLTLKCADCHDPHSGVVQLRQEKVATTRTQCANCHFEEAKYQKNAVHTAINVACTSCHMPLSDKSAWGDPQKFTGDIRTHLMAIDPTQVDQFVTVTEGDTEKTYALSQISLNYACRNCHGGGMGSVKTDEELLAGATGYHDRPATAGETTPAP